MTESSTVEANFSIDNTCREILFEGKKVLESWQFAKWGGELGRYEWREGKETIKGSKGTLSFGHFSGENLIKELQEGRDKLRFVYVDEGSILYDGQEVDKSRLLCLPVGNGFEDGKTTGSAWVVEVSSTEVSETQPLFFDLKPFSENHAQWFGWWSDKDKKRIPNTINIAVEGGSVEDLRNGTMGKYKETEHRHEGTFEVYLMARGRTIMNVIPQDKDPSSISNEINRDLSVALGKGTAVVIYPSDEVYHAEPVPRYSGDPQKTLVIKWAGGKEIDRNDKILHPKLSSL